jgi:hypothetical protein
MYPSSYLWRLVAGITAAATVANAQRAGLLPLGCVSLDTTTADDGNTLSPNSPQACGQYCAGSGNAYIAVSAQ